MSIIPEINNYYFLAAGILSFIVFLVHTFVGGRNVARPFLDMKAEPVLSSLLYYCWHLVTIELFLTALSYFYLASLGAEETGLKFLTIAISVSAVFLQLGIIWKFKTNMLKETPQWIFFAVISAVAILGIL